MSVLTAWSPFFQSGVKQRGRAYQREGRVRRHVPEADELVRAEVEGAEPYEVTLRSEGRQLVATCTCPHYDEGNYCKHIYATLLDVERADGPGASMVELLKLNPRPPRARSRSGDEDAGDEAMPPEASREPEWMGRLTLLRGSDAQPPVPAEVLGGQRRIVYVVRGDLSKRHGGLVVELRQRTPTTAGWSKPKPLRLSPDLTAELDHPLDRELAGTLLGARWVGEWEIGAAPGLGRGQASFLVPPGVRRRLLRAMIQTGRCVFETDEGELQRLRWDDGEPPAEVTLHQSQESAAEANGDGEEAGEAGDRQMLTPWKIERRERPLALTLVGTQGDEELLLNLVLRRTQRGTEGERVWSIGVERPRLVIGGSGGVVIGDGWAAAFDDRDAANWLHQFRDRRFLDTAGDAVAAEGAPEPARRTMRIPESDVDRFLERLYTLEQLPDLDLPEHLDRRAVKVDPVPHLEVYASDAESGSRSSRSGNLTARAWFDYAGQRVVPGQPGRFLTVNTAAVVEGEQEAKSPDEAGQGVEREEPSAGEGTAREDAAQQAASPGDTAGATRLVRRDAMLEREALALLVRLGLRPGGGGAGGEGGEGGAWLSLAAADLPGVVAALVDAGWSVRAEGGVVRAGKPPALSIASGIDWFELRGRCELSPGAMAASSGWTSPPCSPPPKPVEPRWNWTTARGVCCPSAGCVSTTCLQPWARRRAMCSASPRVRRRCSIRCWMSGS